MDRLIPGIARTAFIVHVIVAVIFGATMLVAPNLTGAAFGYPEAAPDLVPVIRSYGAILLFLGGLTSLLALRATSWDRVEIVVQAEIVYMAVASALYIVYLISGSGPVMGNVCDLVMHLVLLVLFWLAWSKRPA